MIVPNKTVMVYNGKVCGPGEWVPDPIKEKQELTSQNVDEVIDKLWDDKPKVKCKK